jgi:hypothetical protein
MNVIIPDNIHIHPRNFKTLCSFLDKNTTKIIRVSEHDNIKSLYGNYEKQADMLSVHIDKISSLSVSELLSYRYEGSNIFNIAKAEMLSLLMSKSNWYESRISSDSEFIINKAFKENREILIMNMAATMFWLSFWKKRLSFVSYKKADICIMFSGSLIYTKALCELLKNTKIRNFVVESFFTGDNYYLEEKYTNIANNSDIKFSNCYERDKNIFLEKIITTVDLDKSVSRSLFILDNFNNKNVTQPTLEKSIKFNKESKTILLLAQVVNDFSILDNELPYINSISIYKEIIDTVITHTEYNLIIKTHPWEKKKINLRESVTFNELKKHLSKYKKKERERVSVVEDHNIYNLFDISDLVSGICSQSLLEATRQGHKVHQFGDSFFKEKGFTEDYDDSESFIEAIKDGLLFSSLSIKEWGNFTEFLAVIFNVSLMSASSSSDVEIRNRMKFISKPQTKPQTPTTNKTNRLYKSILSKKKYKKWQNNTRAFYIDSPIGFLFKR